MQATLVSIQACIRRMQQPSMHRHSIMEFLKWLENKQECRVAQIVNIESIDNRIYMGGGCAMHSPMMCSWFAFDKGMRD